MGHRERSQVMKRTVITLGVVGALLVAPSVASAANVVQVRSQVVESQVLRQQVVRQVVDSQVLRQQVVRQVVRPAHVTSQLKSQRANALKLSQIRIQVR
jgi:hypothetical protein